MTEIDTGKIIAFLLELYLWMSVGYLGYLLRIQVSRTDLGTWLGKYWHSLAISYVFGALICVGLVISPNAAAALGLMGFNAEQGMFAMAFAIGASTLGLTSLFTNNNPPPPVV